MEKMKRLIYMLVIATVVIFVSFGLSTNQCFAEGEDDLSDYIEVKTVKDLYKIRSNMEGKYKLMNDIDLTEATAPGGLYDFNDNGWKPIGNDNNYLSDAFTGVFDGNNHKIKGLNIHSTNNANNSSKIIYLGLFGKNNGIIKNLVITEFKISWSSQYDIYCGIIAGENNGTIENVSVYDSNVSIIKGVSKVHAINSYQYKTYGYIGGISGSNNSSIINAYSEVYVDVEARGDYIDYNPHSSSNDIGFSYVEVGGISNNMNSGAIIKNSYSYCSMKQKLNYNHSFSYSTAFIQCAGINGGDYGTVEDCYNRIGNSYNDYYGISVSGNVKNSYFIGKGLAQKNGSSKNCYYLNSESTNTTGWLGLNDAQMQSSDFFEGFDFENVWRMSDETVYKYPQLQSIKNGVTKVEIISEPSNEIVVGTTLKYEDAVARIYREDGSTEDVELTPENTTGGSTSTTGTITVTYTYKGASATFDIDVVPVKVKELEVTSIPSKVDYVEGQTFDPTGLKVYAIYNNGDRKICNDYALSDIDTTAGEKTVTVSYNSVETSFKVNYVEKKISTLEVTTPPTKTVYDEGESFDKTGMVVKATYNDGEVNEITDYSISDISGYGNVSVEISYEGLTITTIINVRKLVKSIVFDKESVEVYEGESDVLSVSYDPEDADNKDIEWSSSDESIALVNENGEITGIKAGTVEIKAVIKGYDDVFAVCNAKVNAIAISDIEITELPDKLEYKEGEAFDPAGMIVSHIYNSGKEEQCSDYTIGEIQGTGNVKVKISCGKFEKYIDLTVIAITDIEIESMPKKLTYMEGEQFDTSGLVVNKVYGDGSKEICNDYSISKITKTGDTVVTVSYLTFKKDISIYVNTIKDLSWLTEEEYNEYEKLKKLYKEGYLTWTIYRTNYLIDCIDNTVELFVITSDSELFGSYDILNGTTMNFRVRRYWTASEGYSDYVASVDVTKYVNDFNNSMLNYEYSGGDGEGDLYYKKLNPDNKALQVSLAAEETEIYMGDFCKMLSQYNIDINKIGFRSINYIESKPTPTSQPTVFPTFKPTVTPIPTSIPTSKPTVTPIPTSSPTSYIENKPEYLQNVTVVKNKEIYKNSWDSSYSKNYEIVVSKKGILSINATKPNKPGYSGRTYVSLYFTLYDSSGKEIFANNTFKAESDYSNSYSINIGLNSGTYYCSIKPDPLLYFGNNSISSDVIFSFSETDYTEIEPNDSKETATPMLMNKIYKGFFGSDGITSTEKYDYWCVDLEKGENYSFEVFAHNSYISSTNTQIDMCSPNNLYYNMSSYLKKSKDNKVSFTAQESGKHYIVFKLYFGKQYDYTMMFEKISSEQKNSKKVEKETKPSKTKIKSVKNKKGKKLYIKWTKKSGIDGYQIQYALNSSFTKSKKSKTLSKTKSTVTIRGLKKKKKYYVRVRTYVKNSNGKKVYSDWSNIKKVKIKK